MSAAPAREVELAEVLAEVRRIEVQSNRLVTGVMAGGYSSVFRGAGIEFDQVREYAEGDDPRAIDWNVTARLGRPFVKEYVEERERTLLFLLDLSKSMDAGFSAWSPRRMAARICACLALSAARNDDGVGLVAFGTRVEHFVPVRKGTRHVLRVVRDCLALPAAPAATALAPALEFTSRVVRRRAVVFVLSDFLGTGWQSALALCARHHDVVAVRLTVPEMLAPPERGALRVADPRTGRTAVVDFGAAGWRAAFVERVAAFRQATEHDLRRAGADLMDVPIPRLPDSAAIARPILRFFRMREQREVHR